MTREEFEQYAIKNGLVVWSKEQSELAIKALEELPKRRKEAKRWKTKAAQIASKKNRWIPVSERLPENSGNYLITYCYRGEVETQEAVYVVGEEEDKWFDTTDIEITLAVIAWMPLPKPFEPQERSGEE